MSSSLVGYEFISEPRVVSRPNLHHHVFKGGPSSLGICRRVELEEDRRRGNSELAKRTRRAHISVLERQIEREAKPFAVGYKPLEQPPVDLLAYLVDATVSPTQFDSSTQADVFEPLPEPEPYYVAKTGVDVATGICEGDLFVFDVEVQVVLDVLVGKTIEQAQLEVEQEEEVKLILLHEEAAKDRRRKLEEIQADLLRLEIARIAEGQVAKSGAAERTAKESEVRKIFLTFRMASRAPLEKLANEATRKFSGSDPRFGDDEITIVKDVPDWITKKIMGNIKTKKLGECVLLRLLEQAAIRANKS